MRVDTGTNSRGTQDRCDAARALLANPMLTATSHPDEFALVRLHTPALRNSFKSLLGYGLIVESSFARLVKGPVTADAPARPARRPDGSAFTPVTYTQLALLCAALLAPDAGEQTLISSLIDQVRSDAAAIDIPLGDTLTERRALVTAIGQLISWGVLSETDGTATGWSERREEALLTIHRSMLPHLLARSLSGLTNPDELLVTDPQLNEQPRRLLRRKLVENPLVRRDDLSDAERAVLSRERSELTRLLAENFGLTLEVRAEGVLAYDAGGGLSDVVFPGSGTVKQAALLLLSELVSVLRPGPSSTVVLTDGRTAPGAVATWAEVDAALAKLSAEHRRAWGAAMVDHPEQLRREVVALLCAVSLATTVTEGLVIHPAAARYRPRPFEAPRPRAARRLRSGDATASTDEETS